MWAVLEREAYLYLQRRGHHKLPYKQFLRARELKTEIPESQPVYQVGLLHTSMEPEPVPVTMPENHPLARCYRLAEDQDGQEADRANVHLLAALGSFDRPLVPVDSQPPATKGTRDLTGQRKGFTSSRGLVTGRLRRSPAPRLPPPSSPVSPTRRPGRRAETTAPCHQPGGDFYSGDQ